MNSMAHPDGGNGDMNAWLAVYLFGLFGVGFASVGYRAGAKEPLDIPAAMAITCVSVFWPVLVLWVITHNA